MEAILLGVEEAARALGLSRTTLKRLVAAGEIVPVYIGGRTLFRRADLELLADRGTRPPRKVRAGGGSHAP